MEALLLSIVVMAGPFTYAPLPEAPASRLQTEERVYGYGRFQTNVWAQGSQVYTTEIVRPVDPPMPENREWIVVIQKDGSRMFIPTTNLQIREFLRRVVDDQHSQVPYPSP